MTCNCVQFLILYTCLKHVRKVWAQLFNYASSLSNEHDDFGRYPITLHMNIRLLRPVCTYKSPCCTSKLPVRNWMPSMPLCGCVAEVPPTGAMSCHVLVSQSSWPLWACHGCGSTGRELCPRPTVPPFANSPWPEVHASKQSKFWIQNCLMVANQLKHMIQISTWSQIDPNRFEKQEC